jgi:hypothetical protein
MKPITRALTVLVFTGWASSAPAAPIPDTDTVTVDGMVWAQSDLFTNLSWDDINDVCPLGECTGGVTLNGYDMTDWFWASPDDVNALFNFYIGSDDMGPGPSSNSDIFDDSASAFFLDEWRPTTDDGMQTETRGWLNQLSDNSEAYQGSARTETDYSYLSTSQDLSQATGTADAGAWFYRPRPVGPITDTVVVAGREWAQPDLFTNLTWDEINAVCPGGTCEAGGILKGNTMTRWVWATNEDLKWLLLHYGADLFSISEPYPSLHEDDSAWAPAFYGDSWRETYINSAERATSGWLSDIGPYGTHGGVEEGILEGFFDSAWAEHPDPQDSRERERGAWFYRATGPTIDLVFSGTTGAGTTGTDTIRAKAGDVLTLDIVVTDHDGLGICVALLSLYWNAGVLTGSNAESCPSPPNTAPDTCNDSLDVTYYASGPVTQDVGSAEDFVTGADCIIGGTILGFVGESMTLGRIQFNVETKPTSDFDIEIGYLPDQGILDGTLTPEYQPAATATVLPPAGC